MDPLSDPSYIHSCLKKSTTSVAWLGLLSTDHTDVTPASIGGGVRVDMCLEGADNRSQQVHKTKQATVDNSEPS